MSLASKAPETDGRGKTVPTNGVLIAGIGNIFLGDDAFGVEVAARLRERALPKGVVVRDFGIRGVDLVYALQSGECVAAILVDTVSRGHQPGTLYVMETDDTDDDRDAVPLLAAHDLDPFAAVRLARSAGVRTPVFVVGCEPESFGIENDEAGRMGLSVPVADSVDRAADIVEELATQLAGPEGMTIVTRRSSHRNAGAEP